MKMAKKTSAQEYVGKAIALGAKEAGKISARSVVTAAWVRMKCRFGCSGYGQGLRCPPYTPTHEETAKVLKCYRVAILLHGDGRSDMTEMVTKLEREAFLDGYHKAFAMGAGPCGLCSRCNVKAGECRHPEAARPAMEACGIDVYQTARNNGYPIEVVRDYDGSQDYYGLVLLE